MKRKLRAYKKTVSIVNETAIGIYESLGKDKIGFLMESNDKEQGRYTFMGADPEEIVQSSGDSLVITRADGTKEVRNGNPLEQLKEYYSEFEIVNKEDAALEFTGGLVGSFGYDFIRYTEELPDYNEDEIGIETIQLMFASKFIAIDHVAETFTAVVLAGDNKDGEEYARKELDKMVLQARKNEKTLVKTHKHDGIIIKKSDTCEQYMEKVNKIKQYIKDGHIFQTVLSQRWTIETEQEGFELYKELRELNPSPYLYYYNFGEFEIIGSSPEMIVKQTDNRVYTCPIAGTRKRGATLKEDMQLEQELLEDEKERAEHVMLVDLARNDMGRIAQIGSVKVTEFMKIQRYSHVMHIVSLVEGKKTESITRLI